MDKKTIIATSVTFAVTAILGLIFAAVVGAFDDEIEQHERGGQALEEELIKKVVAEAQKVTVNGITMTYGEVISSIDTRLTRMETAIEILTE